MLRTSRLRALAREVLRRAWSHAGLLLVLGVAVVDRILFLAWWRAFPGGDTYNFIVSAQELLRGSYPIAEKRLPFYPLLIALTHSFLDWEVAAIAVALAASLVSIALLYALGRTLKISKIALVVALLPFQAIAPFLFQSVRGYADTTFVALILGALVQFMRLRTRRGAWGLGVLLAAACLTRPEGIAFAITVLLLLTLDPRRRLMLPTFAVVLLLLGGFAAFSLHVGRPLAPREYLLDAEVSAFGVTSIRAFAANYGLLWQAVGVDRLWGEPLRLLQDVRTPSLGRAPHRLWSFLTDPKEVPSLLLLAGLIFLLRKRRLAFLAVLVTFLALAAPIAWWGVRQRFLLVVYPLPFLVLAAGAHALLDRIQKTSARLGRPAPGVSQSGVALPIAHLALLILSLGFWSRHTAAEAREVQAKNWGNDYAYYQVIQAARRLPGVIAFERRSSIVLALFGEIDNHGRALFADVHLNTPYSEEQWAVLAKYRAQYVVIHGTTSGALPVLLDSTFRDRFHVVRTFTHPETRGRVDTAVILAVRQ